MSRNKKIKIAIVGVGNCAASLLQGIDYYRKKKNKNKTEDHIGLMNYTIGTYKPADIHVVAAFDIDRRKVGKPVDQAIYALPNCVQPIRKSIAKTNVKVKMGHILDGMADHMKNYPPERSVLPADNKPVDVVDALKKSKAEILLNYLPVGSEKAARFYAQCCLSAGVSFVNCMPVFIVSDPKWEKKFKAKGIPCVGDDIKAQIGATVVHRALAKLFTERGVRLDRTYQLNTGGNTDFLNMLNRDRVTSKKISKTEAVQSQLENPLAEENIHIGPSDYVPWQNDNKVCFIRMEGRGFGGFPMNLEMRLSVEDSPNSAGVAIDAIRCCRLARDRKIGGALTSISAFTMKHPPVQFSDTEAKELTAQFVDGVLDS